MDQITAPGPQSLEQYETAHKHRPRCGSRDYIWGFDYALGAYITLGDRTIYRDETPAEYAVVMDCLRIPL